MRRINVRRQPRFLLFLVVILAFLASGVGAQDVTSDPVEARLVAQDLSIQPARPFMVGLLMKMKPGWHVYWKYPGDSGLPTTLKWSLPAGFTAGPLLWPVPERFVTDGLVTYGYSGQVLLMTEITPPTGVGAGSTVKLEATAGWLACLVACTPGSADLQVALPVSGMLPRIDDAWASAFSQARSRLPVKGDPGAFTARADSGHITLDVQSAQLPPGSSTLFYPDAPGQVNVSNAQVMSGGGNSLRMDQASGGAAPSRLSGILVTGSPQGPRAVEVDTPVSVTSVSVITAGAGDGIRGLVAAILLAFIGGLILNLMPCVLPVISLKVVSFVRHGRTEGRGRAWHGLLFTLGVLVSFWIIAGILLGLRAGGRLLGWGFQFQDPAVVVVTAVLFFLIGLNLFGVFQIGTVLTRLGGGRGPSGTTGTGGAATFLNGMFATAVATPCTAPFMGAAVGYALSHSVGASLTVFTALGLGMSAPYFVLAVVPGLLRRLPKPGPWMDTFRQVMAFPMMAAAVWMVWVLAALSGSNGVLLILGAILAAGMGAWAWGRWGALSRTLAVRVAAGTVGVLLVVGGTAAAAVLLPSVSAASVSVASVPFASTASASTAGAVPAPAGAALSSWEPWSQARIDSLRLNGTPVFVDFTAKWCLTCQVNEKAVLDDPAVRAAFQKSGIAALRADWTDSSPAIARALAGFGRASVPLYVFYPRDGKEPVLLPEILTRGIVLGAIADTGWRRAPTARRD
jgi:thiol:disulfide interchange protein DsbD